MPIPSKCDADIVPRCFVLLGMNEYSQPPAGKINLHGNGLGAPTPEQIEQRAREIALIDERNPDEFTDGDWDQARMELAGKTEHSAPEETKASEAMEEDWEVTANDRGHRAPRAGFDDDETLGEQLVAGGVDEATHDQMLEARREELEQEGGIT
jgi:hypothetical protein